MDEDNSVKTETGLEGPSPDVADAGDTHGSVVPADGFQVENGAPEQQQTAAAQHQGQQQQPHTSAGSAAAEAASAEHAKLATDADAATSPTVAAKQHNGDTIVGSDADTGEAAAAAGEPVTSAAAAESDADAAASIAAAEAAANPKAAAAAGVIGTAKQQASSSAETATDSEQAASALAVAGTTSPEQQHATEHRPSAAAIPAADMPAAMEAPAKPPAPSPAAAEHPTDAAVQPPAESATSPPAAASKPAAAKLAVAKKPTAAKKKPAQVSVSGGSGGGGAGAAAAASPVAVPSTHGSNPAKKGLHTLFGEASTLSVLSQEGSEMPGSRPPAQLHAALDGHDHGPIGETLMDDEEQQEIQKIISEIHGNGDDSDGDESQDDRLADIKHQHLMPHADAPQHSPGSQGSSAAGEAVPSSLMMPQQQTADDLLVYEQSGSSPGAAAASVGPAAESSAAMPAEDMHSPQQQRGRGSPSPWPGVTQIQHELLDPDTSVEPTPAAHAAAAKPLAQHTGSLGHQLSAAEPSGHNPAGYDPDSYAESAAVEDEGLMGPGPEGSADDQAEGVVQGLGEGGGSYGGFEGGGGDEEQRSRAIAEQLAQLHEESRRLHLQSQLLQHQAIEMSLQMATSANVGSSSSSPAADPHTSSHHPTHHISNIGAHPNSNQQEQQAMSYNPAAGSSHSSTEDLGLGFSQAVTPGGVPLNPESLGLIEGAVPRHPPGDSTPSSVTSSRAGLNWNIPSRGGIPSPGKAGGMSPALPGSPNLRSADARSNFNTITHGFALHADPSLDYQMYTYANDNSSSHAAPISNSAAAADYGYQPPLPQQLRQQQQPMQELYGHYQQQQQRDPAHEQDLYQQPQHQMISAQQQHQQQSHQHHVSDNQQHHDAGHARSMDHKAADTKEHDPPSPTAAASGHGGRAYRSQRSLRGSKPGHTQPQKPVEPPLVVRKPTLPVKQGSGASTRVAAAGATAGRRLSSDNVTSYYSLADETPVVGTFNAAHAVVGAQGTVAKAKQQQQTAGKLSPRASLTSATAAAAAAGGGKAAAGTAATSSAAAAAAAAAATSKLTGGSHKPVAAAGRSRSSEVSPDHGSSAAALAAAAAAATSSSGGYPQQNRQRMHPHPAPPPPPAAAGPWGSGPVNPYAAAAMYGGGYAAVNPGLVPMMMQNPMQATGNTNSSKKGLGSKISPGRAAGGNNMSHPESLTSMTAAMPPGAMWMPVGIPPGFMPVMPPGHMSASRGKGGLVPPGSNPNKIAAGRGIGGSNSAPSGVQYGLPGIPPAQFMPMPGMPGQMGYPRMGFAPHPFAMNPQQAAMAAGGGKGGAAGKFPALGHNTVQQGGGNRAGKGSMPAGIPPGYMPAPPGGYGMPAAAAAAYPAAGGPWGPMMGPPGQFGMMPMYAAAPGVMAGYQQQQQQGGKGGKGGAGGKGGWQS